MGGIKYWNWDETYITNIWLHNNIAKKSQHGGRAAIALALLQYVTVRSLLIWDRVSGSSSTHDPGMVRRSRRCIKLPLKGKTNKHSFSSNLTWTLDFMSDFLRSCSLFAQSSQFQELPIKLSIKVELCAPPPRSPSFDVNNTIYSSF